jgi:taurine dioxygenase
MQSARKVEVRRLGYALGAEVLGVDCRHLDDETTAALRAAWLEHIVLCFPQQHLKPAEFREFCGRFGALDDNRAIADLRDPHIPEVMIVVNKPIELEGKSYTGHVTDKWHTDLSFTEHPTTASFLSAEVLPDCGGATMFANMYAALETLSPATRRMLEPLEAVHDIARASGKTLSHDPAFAAAIEQANVPVAHPILRTHPETGRTCLYLGSHAWTIDGMTVEESRPIIEFLNRHATRYENTYRHRWSLGDVVMWDNRCALHYAVRDYDQTQVRRMRRASLLGPREGRVVPRV